jgi:hypothetical protein
VDTTLASTKFSFVWSELTGAYTGDVSGNAKNTRYLTIPAESLRALTTYTFNVVGFLSDSPNVNNTASVNKINK